MTQSKYWCFTVNNYTDDEFDQLSRLEPGALFTYLVCGREKGAAGTPHLQGYIELPTRQRMSGVKKIPGLARAHLEKRRGTSEQASDYCKKEEDFFELGDRSQAAVGKRSLYEEAVTALREGATIDDLWKEHTGVMIRYAKGFKDAKIALQPKKKLKTFDLETFKFQFAFEAGRSHILVGPSGVGKTSYVRSKFPEALMVSHMDDLLQFDPTYHTAIIFDDMSFTHMPRTAQIHLVDQDDDRSIHCRYQTAFIPAGTMKIFTTNVENIFDLTDEAIKRRVKVNRVVDLSGK